MKKFFVTLFAVCLACTTVFAAGCEEDGQETTGTSCTNGGGDPVCITETELLEFSTWYFTSGVPNNVITAATGNENAVLECTAEIGELSLIDSADETDVITLAEGQSCYWWVLDSTITADFITVKMKENGTYTGYAVVYIAQRNGLSYTPTVVKSVRLDAAVTETEIDALIAEAKKEYSEELANS